MVGGVILFFQFRSCRAECLLVSLPSRKNKVGNFQKIVVNFSRERPYSFLLGCFFPFCNSSGGNVSNSFVLSCTLLARHSPIRNLKVFCLFLKFSWQKNNVMMNEAGGSSFLFRFSLLVTFCFSFQGIVLPEFVFMVFLSLVIISFFRVCWITTPVRGFHFGSLSMCSF